MTKKYITIENVEALKYFKYIIDLLFKYYEGIHYLYKQKDYFINNISKYLFISSIFELKIKEIAELNSSIQNFIKDMREIYSERISVNSSFDSLVESNYSIVDSYVSAYVVKKEIDYISKTRDCSKVVDFLNSYLLLFKTCIETNFETIQ
ncbi:hypothetical protein Psfp_03893 [Pelotomaculum sp. FP]|uniref:hypothetical protein n=1 Tax=Pelotomaculum sp. FP TaxID=261474 RepID=UPI0010666B08|nr:hypothetical protein [Pelotomaculum sp. FP]TEB11764.1 hypothetical protein Psfp_03893 [Pelotomaculum sp. FP]